MCKLRMGSCQLLVLAACVTSLCLLGNIGVSRAGTTSYEAVPPPWQWPRALSACDELKVIDYSLGASYRGSAGVGPGVEETLSVANAALYGPPDRSQARLFCGGSYAPCGPVTIKADCPVWCVSRIAFANPSSGRAAGASPVIERYWAGLGGHRLSGKRFFPVFADMRAGTTPWTGWLCISSGGLLWQTAVSVPAHEARRVEIEAGQSHDLTTWSNLGPGSSTPTYWMFLTTSSSGRPVEHNAFTRFSMDPAPAADYWITPNVGEASSLDSVIAVVPGRRGMELEPPRLWPVPQRIEAISPELLPSTAMGWEPASRVIVDATVLSTLKATARTALLAWVASGGHLIITPVGRGAITFDSGLAITNRTTYQIQPFGRGTVRVWPSLDQALLTLLWHIDTALGGQAYSGGNASDLLLQKASAGQPKIKMPRGPILIGCGIGYLLLFGPVGLGLMRRSRRILVVWLIVPGLACAATLVVLFAGSLLSESMQSVNTDTVGVVSSGASVGMQQSDMLVFTPKPGSCSILTGTQALSDVDRTAAVDGTANIDWPGGVWSSTRDLIQAGEHHLVLEDLPSYGERQVTLRGPVAIPGNLTAAIRPDGSGRLENNTSEPVPASFIALGAWRARVPVLSAQGHYDLKRRDWLKLDLSTAAISLDSSQANMRSLVFPAHQAYWAVPNSRWIGIPEDPAVGGQRHTILLVDCGAMDLKL